MSSKRTPLVSFTADEAGSNGHNGSASPPAASSPRRSQQRVPSLSSLSAAGMAGGVLGMGGAGGSLATRRANTSSNLSLLRTSPSPSPTAGVSQPQQLQNASFGAVGGSNTSASPAGNGSFAAGGGGAASPRRSGVFESLLSFATNGSFSGLPSEAAIAAPGGGSNNANGGPHDGEGDPRRAAGGAPGPGGMPPLAAVAKNHHLLAMVDALKLEAEQLRDELEIKGQVIVALGNSLADARQHIRQRNAEIERRDHQVLHLSTEVARVTEDSSIVPTMEARIAALESELSAAEQRVAGPLQAEIKLLRQQRADDDSKMADWRAKVKDALKEAKRRETATIAERDAALQTIADRDAKIAQLSFSLESSAVRGQRSHRDGATATDAPSDEWLVGALSAAGKARLFSAAQRSDLNGAPDDDSLLLGGIGSPNPRGPSLGGQGHYAGGPRMSIPPAAEALAPTVPSGDVALRLSASPMGGTFGRHRGESVLLDSTGGGGNGTVSELDLSAYYYQPEAVERSLFAGLSPFQQRLVSLSTARGTGAATRGSSEPGAAAGASGAEDPSGAPSTTFPPPRSTNIGRSLTQAVNGANGGGGSDAGTVALAASELGPFIVTVRYHAVAATGTALSDGASNSSGSASSSSTGAGTGGGAFLAVDSKLLVAPGMTVADVISDVCKKYSTRFNTALVPAQMALSMHHLPSTRNVVLGPHRALHSFSYICRRVKEREAVVLSLVDRNRIAESVENFMQTQA